MLKHYPEVTVNGVMRYLRPAIETRDELRGTLVRRGRAGARAAPVPLRSWVTDYHARLFVTG